jgi:hypothetical protein
MYIGGPFSVNKRQGREADHSPLPNAEVKNAWSYTSILLTRFYGKKVKRGKAIPVTGRGGP